nr:peptide chain release factor N(5)-glutamine methyltransferase [Corynebacterium lactis]
MKPNNPSGTEQSSPGIPDSVRGLGELLRYVRTSLSDAGIASPEADARAIFGAATSMGPVDVIFRGDQEYSDEAGRTRLSEMLRRRLGREPLQHILGTAPMLGLELAVGPGVFVPRPETELLAQWAIDEARKLVEGGVGKPRIVDLCTGSGALALAIADAVPESEILAVELSEEALVWTRTNLVDCQARWGGEWVSLVHGDVTDLAALRADEALATWWGRTDIVVSNPPYVPDDAEVSAEVLADPHTAVFGGSDGLDVIRPMMNVVDGLLRDGGVVGIEHDDSSGADMARLLGADWNYNAVAVQPDLAGRDRFTVGVKPR